MRQHDGVGYRVVTVRQTACRLSLRNRLLNFKDTKQTLPFLCPDVSTLENQQADGTKFRTLPLKDEDPIGNRDLLISDEQQMLAEVARDAFAKGQIAVPLTGKEANNRLLELYRRANSDLQEGGTNTLFLAAGYDANRPHSSLGNIDRRIVAFDPLRTFHKLANAALRLPQSRHSYLLEVSAGTSGSAT